MNKSRRKFLTQSACGLSAAALVSAADRLGLINSIVQAQNTPAADYKALVCVFLSGGSDCNNMVVPYDQYNAAGGYFDTRNASGLAVAKSALLPITPSNTSGIAYGLHPNLSPEVANVGQGPGLLGPWNQGKLAILCNYGPLLRPTLKAQYQSNVGGAYRPYQLFSHSDQVNQQMSSIVNTTGQTGWAGRVADNTGGLNGPTILPMSLSVGGTNLLQTGITTRQIAIGTGSLQNVLSLNWGGPASAAPFTNGSGFRQLLSFDTNQVLIKGASDTMNTALSADQILNQPDPTIPTPPNVTAFPNTNIGNQLKQVAKLIKIKDTLGMKRQIFFCTLGGFDTHTNETGSDPANPGGQGTQSGTQGGLLAQFSQAARAFYDEMNAQGNGTSVTLFTLSDFGRTFQPSGSGTASVGSDHAWGSHAFIMGGAVVGGMFYGSPRPDFSGLPYGYPNLLANGPDDDGGNRGRWIPTTSIDQYGATLARWYGLDPALLPIIFPNLSKFGTQNIGFLG